MLLRLLRAPTIYVRLSPEGIVASNPRTGTTRSETDSAAFQHPRVILDDFQAATKLLRDAVRTVNSSAMIRPLIVMHWTTAVEGGLSRLELRALQEMAQAAGAREVVIVHPQALPSGEAIPAEVLSRAYSAKELTRALIDWAGPGAQLTSLQTKPPKRRE